jgi:PAS domain S-box-containing protein
MDAIITVDEQQKIVLYNHAAERLFGWPRQEVMGQPLERLIPDRFRHSHARHVERFGSTGETSRHMGARTVVYGLRANGHEFPLDASISWIDSGEGKLFTVILRDITGRLQAAELQLRLEAMLDSAMDAIVTVDQTQRIVGYNRAAEKIFGWPRDEALDQSLDKLLPKRFHAAHGDHIRRFAATSISSRRMGDGTVVYGLRANREEFPMDASIYQLETADGRLYPVILRDVTERVRLQEERDALAAAAHAIREEEKARVARELHDELAQCLTALKMDTLWVRDNAPTRPEAASAKLTEMLEMLDRAVASTRRIAADLRPMLLDDLGLVAAIEWLVSNFTERCGVACKLSVDAELQLQEPYATAVFRIVQESLANVAKHADASQVSVAVDKVPGGIALTVLDNGRGFFPAAARQPHSLGLLGLRERARLLKGRVLIDSAPGQGTRVEVHIPLPQAGAYK